MASGLNKHHILEAIDKLRSRKSRPDAFRIVSYVSKKYEFPKNEIKDYLEMLSKDGTVLKVEFKGSFSYRNAANHRNATVKAVSPTTQEQSCSRESLSDLITATLARLIVEEPDYLDIGISMNQLYDHLDYKVRKTITKTYFKEVLYKEVKNRNLVRFENGNYCLGYPSNEPISFSPNVSDVSQTSEEVTKEKSKSPVPTVEKYPSPPRQSSPSSSKHSSCSEKIPMTVSQPPKRKTYAKKKARVVSECTEELDKNETPPSRESRRKRFQKIVFDPSDSPRPRKLKDKKTGLVSSSKLRGPYRKQYKETESSQVKIMKRIPVPGSRHSTRSSTSTNLEARQEQVKQDLATDEDSDNDSTDSRRHCKICGFSIDFKSSRSIERWTSCHFCGKRAHVTCIEDTEQWTRFKLSKWQCNDCKSCVACQKKNKESGDTKLILCVLCDDAYHYSCANIKKLTHKWFCSKCSVFKDGVLKSEVKSEKEEFGPMEMTSNESSQRTTPEPEEKKTSVKGEEPVEKEASTSQEEVDYSQMEIDESIPDCSNWTCEEVYNYFAQYFSPEDASVFRDQEIDGKVLLLLSRYDVLRDFKLKLGPALKIYAHVKKLQVRRSDPRLFWP